MANTRDRIEARLGLSGPPLRHIRPDPPAIPDHKLFSKVGQGAYGEVWLAQNALGTWRAIKIVYRENFKEARPYEREFAGIRRFEPLSRANEGFVDILQVGRNEEEGWFYYVMELADSVGTQDPEERSQNAKSPASCPLSPETYSPRTLSRELRQRSRLPLDQTLELGLTLSLALGHLHRHGLIHRDVKPSNIIFLGGVPKLADIGLVTEQSEANTFVGTEGFVPPEGPTSAKADLYALGKVLYEAAMGKDRNEFPEPYTRIKADAESIALMELNAVLLRACAPNPDERYSSAEEMHADLALLHSGGSVKRRHQLERHFRLAQRAGALAIILLLLASAAWFWQQHQTGKMAQLARANAALATERSVLADHLSKIAETNRESLVHLSIANGLRTFDEGDPAGALLWFANALPLITNKPAEESIHRIRIQHALERAPRIRRVFPHESGLAATAFSSDGRLIATLTKQGNVRVWNADDGSLKWGPKLLPVPASFLRFTGDGKRLFISSSPEQGTFNGSLPEWTAFAVLEAETGEVASWPDGAFERVTVAGLNGAYFSPDDRCLATTHGDNVIRVYSMDNGHRIAELLGHTGIVLSVAFSVDGTLLASASADRTVRLWRLPDGKALGPPLEHSWPAVRVLFAAKVQSLVTMTFENLGDDGGAEIHVWNLVTHQRGPAKIEARDKIGLFVAPGSDGPFFVQDRAPNPIRAYKFPDGRPARFNFNFGGVISWDFSKDGTRLVLGLGDHIARVFDLRTGAPVTSPFRHGRWGVNSVQFCPVRPLLLTGCEDGNARLWDLNPLPEETLRRRMPTTPMPRLTARFFKEQGRSSEVFALHVWEGTAVNISSAGVFNERLEELYRFNPDQPGTEIVGPFLSRDGKCWGIRVNDPKSFESIGLRLARYENGEPRQVKLPHPNAILDSAFTPDSRFLISASVDRCIRFWRVTDGGLERTVELRTASEGVFADISPDGRTVLWREQSSKGGKPTSIFRFFDIDSGTFIGAPIETESSILEYVFSPDGQMIAFADQLGSVTVRESRAGRLLSSSIRHPANLSPRLQWDFESRRLLTVGENDEAHIWDAKTGKELVSPLRTPGSIIRNCRFSPDGRFIVTAGNDNKARVWDASSGEMVTSALQHDGVLSTAFITKSNRLISVNYGAEQLRAWDLKETSLSAELLLDYAKYLSGRRLDSSGAMLALTPDELSELDRSLRQRAPNLFN